MYFKEFPTIFYTFPGKSVQDLESRFQRVVTDITQNVRARKDIFNDILIYDEYDIKDNETPEVIADKYYGSSLYHWIIMLANQRYDYLRDYPMSELELKKYIEEKYGFDNMHKIHHYEKDGDEVQPQGYIRVDTSIIESFQPGDYIYTPSSLSIDTSYITSDDTLTYTVDQNTIPVDGIFAEVNFVETDLNRVWITLYSFKPLNEDLSYFCIIKRGTTNIHVFSIQGDGFTPADRYIPLTNYDYEVQQNEAKRRIKLISRRLLSQILEEFRDLI